MLVTLSATEAMPPGKPPPQRKPRPPRCRNDGHTPPRRSAVLPPTIKALPNVTDVQLATETTANDGRIYRVWRATVRSHDGNLHECVTYPVLHEPPVINESKVERRRREVRVQQRTLRALRALDPEALAIEHARDRIRKRIKAAQRLSQLPVLVGVRALHAADLENLQQAKTAEDRLTLLLDPPSRAGDEGLCFLTLWGIYDPPRAMVQCRLAA